MINVKVDLLDQKVDVEEIVINQMINVKVELLDQNVDVKRDYDWLIDKC